MLVNEAKIRLEQFQFRDELKEFQTLGIKFFKSLFHIFNIIDTSPLLYLRGYTPTKPASIPEMGKVVGYVEPPVQELLAFHDSRLNRYHKIEKMLLYPLMLVLFLISILLVMRYGLSAVSSVVGSLDHLSFNDPALLFILKALLYAVLIIPLIALYYLIPTATSLKLVSLFNDRPYAESIAIYSVMCVLVQLCQEEVLTKFDLRKELLQRLNDLSRATQMLSLHYISKDEDNKSWSRNHFRHMVRYIRERERWVIAPRETTLGDLRRDFSWLCNVYLWGRYGDVSWDEREKKEIRVGDEEDQGVSERERVRAGEQSGNWWQGAPGVFLRVSGIVLPLAVLVYLILDPGRVENIPIVKNLDMESLTFYALAWTFIGLDNFLNLGVVSSVFGVAKGLKGQV